VTGRRPPIHVHRHHNKQLQLTLGSSSIRRGFISAFGLRCFCEELVTGDLHGVSSCIYYCSMYRVDLDTVKWDRIHICTGFPSHRPNAHYLLLDLWWK
jgi:hypothetical protein